MVLFNPNTEKKQESTEVNVSFSVGSHPDKFIKGCLFLGKSDL